MEWKHLFDKLLDGWASHPKNFFEACLCFLQMRGGLQQNQTGQSVRVKNARTVN